MNIDIKSQIAILKRDLNTIGREFVDRSASQAINKTMPKVVTEARGIVKAQTNLPKQAYINKKIAFNKRYQSTYKTLYAKITTKTASAANLIEYVKGDITRFRRRTKTGKYKRTAQRGVKAKPFEQNIYHPGTFIGRGKNSGKMLVFKRTGKSRDSKLKVVHGASLRHIFSRDDTMQLLQRKARSEFPIELNRALKNNINRKLKRKFQ